ncbi:MAG: hypothetical protein HY890_03080 [Deltaproteobacteria bacterium]|nr:hypothetical protein [Deltaproteobacteria bacterium]
MGYDILSRVIELTDSDFALDVKLRKVAGLLARQLPVDGCEVYLWDRKDRRFRATAHGRGGAVEAYGEKQGLPGRVKKTGRAIEVSKKDPESCRGGGVEDMGLRGFRGAMVYPLRDGKEWYGVLYLKTERKSLLPGRRKKMIGVISKQIASSIKSERNYVRLRNAYNKLKDLQVRLVNAEKLMALGELSASLAHEIRNPLVSIGGFAARLRKKIEPGSPHLPYVEHISKQVTRLEEIINDILNFAEHREMKLNVAEVNAVVEDALWLFEEACHNQKIKVVKALSKEPMPVVADAHQLKIAFDNLIANAIQSMEHGGKLTVRTRRENDLGVVDITDSGGGIEPGIIGNIFNPFFTTKKTGTGLGLTITHKIITRHRGVIDVANDYGRGITFTVKLPCTDARGTLPPGGERGMKSSIAGVLAP